MHPHPNQDVLLSTRKGLFRLRDGQLDLLGFLGVQVSNAVRDPRDGRIHAALDHGHFGCKLQYSDDDGATWVETDAPAYPQPTNGEVHVDPVRGEPVEWSTKLIWTIEPGHASRPGELWCGTIPGGMFRSTDRGETWSLVESLWDHPTRSQWFGGGFDDPGLHSISLHPSDPDTLAVGLSAGGVWVTRDGTRSWAPATGMNAPYTPPEEAGNPAMQDPHRIARCPAAPEVAWVQHHGGMYRSTDGCSSWTEITGVDPSTFGFAVAAHPTDPDTAWFVPAASDEVRVPVDGRVVVTRTRDGGATFEQLTDGLPQHNAWHLVYRHGLDVDASGEQLVLGSTSGGVWTSIDGGDHWTEVTNDLPPVLAVRFT
ncbi:MAG TPA: hypothetical protein VNQ73_23155 [Ilumatobacter sp.]|nr:hypothetical protein [Ilumatobacter sp.]